MVEGLLLDEEVCPQTVRSGTFKKSGIGKHRIFIAPFPKDRNCEVCKRTKITPAPCRKRTGNPVPRAEHFCDLITADHKVLSEERESRKNHRYAVAVQDLATQWVHSYLCETKASQEMEKSLRKLLEPTEKPKVISTDNSLEFGKACENLFWNHRTSTPHRSETNGIAERAVRRIEEGTSAVLLQSGLDEKWWADSMECYCYLRNVQDLLSDGKTLYEQRFGEPFRGPVIPFGSMMEYHPTSAKDKSRLHQFGEKKFTRNFPRMRIACGRNPERRYFGRRHWGAWCNVDVSEIHARRLSAREVLVPKSGEFSTFPVADGTVNLSGRDLVFRKSSSIQDHPARGEGCDEDRQGESGGSQPLDTFSDDNEARNDFWSIAGRYT